MTTPKPCDPLCTYDGDVGIDSTNLPHIRHMPRGGAREAIKHSMYRTGAPAKKQNVAPLPSTCDEDINDRAGNDSGDEEDDDDNDDDATDDDLQMMNKPPLQ